MVIPSQIQFVDTVGLVSDVLDLGQAAGEVDGAAEVPNYEVLEIEFCDSSGYTYGLYTTGLHLPVHLHTQGYPLRTRHR
jgi:hypothetical protein